MSRCTNHLGVGEQIS